MSGDIVQHKWIKILIAGVLVPLAALYFGIWQPFMSAFHISVPEISDEIIISSKNHTPELKETIVQSNYSDHVSLALKRDAVNLSDQLLSGTLDVNGYPQLDKNDPFNDDRALIKSSSWRLAYTGFIIPNLYLEAYKISGEDKYLNAALDYVLEWSDKEETKWNSLGLIANETAGFVWNDHAVALRSELLMDLWVYYEGHPEFDLEMGRRLLTLASRYAAFLSHNSNYTYKTNHGMMQNLSVLKMIVFFNEVDNITAHRDLIIKNLTEQLGYLISDEGVVTENSAGYNAIVLSLISNTIQFFDLLNVEIDPALFKKYNLGISYLKTLRRPDGTLPKYGDTNENYDDILKYLIDLENLDDKFHSLDSNSWKPENSNTLKPNSGYAIWWSGLNEWPSNDALSQTTISWSYYPYLAHFHSDELSLNIWKDGFDWWSSMGYWPYSDNRRSAGISWNSSNAPHLKNEPFQSNRTASMLSHFTNGDVNFIELERTNDDGFQVNRQIINLDGTIWITLDTFVDDQERSAQVIWNQHHALSSELKGNSVRTTAMVDEYNTEMITYFHGSEGMEIQKLSASEEPLAGWTAIKENILPANAYQVNVASNGGWTSNISIIDENQDNEIVPTVTSIERTNENEWSIILEHNNEKTEITRKNDIVTVINDAVTQEFKTVAGRINETDKNQVYDNFIKAGEIHGKRFLPLIGYRIKMSWAVLGVIFVNLLLLTLLRNRRIMFHLNFYTSMVFFGGLYYWLAFSYFYT